MIFVQNFKLGHIFIFLLHSRIKAINIFYIGLAFHKCHNKASFCAKYKFKSISMAKTTSDVKQKCRVSSNPTHTASH